MKNVLGGSGGSQTCSGGGLNNTTCTGTCLPEVTFDPNTGTLNHRARTCTAETKYAVNGSGASITVCYCL